MILWAVLTGTIIGAVWVGIGLADRQRRRRHPLPELPEELDRRLDRLDAVEQRLAEVEERLDFAERLLAESSSGPARLPKPGDEGA